MRITLERIGGFTGLRMTRVINTEILSPDDANRLQQLVDDADFFHQPEEIVASTPRPDRFEYKLSVEDGSIKHTVTVSEEAMSQTLRLLVERITTTKRKL
jgi:hypothetical protein